MVLTAAALWGTSGYFARIIGLPAVTTAFYRMLVPTMAIGAYFLVTGHRIATHRLRTRILASVLNVVRMIFYFIAYANTTMANAVVMLYTWPIFAALFGRILLGERISRTRAALLALAFAGVPLLYLGNAPNAHMNHTLGMSAMLLSAAFHALAIVLLKRAGTGGNDFETPFFQNVAGAVLLLPAPFLDGVTATAGQLSAALAYGLVVGVAGFTLFFKGLQAGRTAAAANLAYFEIVVGVALGAAVFGEVPGLNTWIGGGLIICAVLLSKRVRD